MSSDLSSNITLARPQMLECCQYTDDAYWRYIFENLSCNITPYGVNISSTTMYTNCKGKEFSYRLDVKRTSKELFEDITRLFKDKMGMKSPMDIQTSKAVKKVHDSWKGIRKKLSKELYIEEYVTRKGTEYSLSAKQMSTLLSNIHKGLAFKTIASDDIIMRNTTIDDIAGISFEYRRVVYDRDFIGSYPYEHPFHSTHTPMMIDIWRKYIEN
jgi:hypothetical protein